MAAHDGLSHGAHAVKATTLLRLVLSALLVVGVYRETGIFTATAVALFIAHTELTALVAARRRR